MHVHARRAYLTPRFIEICETWITRKVTRDKFWMEPQSPCTMCMDICVVRMSKSTYNYWPSLLQIFTPQTLSLSLWIDLESSPPLEIGGSSWCDNMSISNHVVKVSFTAPLLPFSNVLWEGYMLWNLF